MGVPPAWSSRDAAARRGWALRAAWRGSPPHGVCDVEQTGAAPAHVSPDAHAAAAAKPSADLQKLLELQ